MHNDLALVVIKILKLTETACSNTDFYYDFLFDDLVVVFTNGTQHLLSCRYQQEKSLPDNYTNFIPLFNWEGGYSTAKSSNFFYLIFIIACSLSYIFYRNQSGIGRLNAVQSFYIYWHREFLSYVLELYFKISMIVSTLGFSCSEVLQVTKGLSNKNLTLFRLFPSKWMDKVIQVFREILNGEGAEETRILEETHTTVTNYLTPLAHELKLPLFNIKSFLETLYEYNFKLTEDRRLEFLETANKEANRLVHLIDNILAFQSLQVAELYEFENFNLMELIVQVVNSYFLLSQNKKVRFSYVIEPLCCYSYGNSDLIAQVINNLVGNSMKYTFTGKKILIRTKLFTSFSALNLQKKN